MRYAFLVQLLLSINVAAQPTTLPDLSLPRNRTIVGGQMAVGQLVAELRQLPNLAGGMPPPMQANLRQRCDLAISQIVGLNRLIQTGAPWATFQAQIGQIERAITDIGNVVQQIAPADRNLNLAARRTQFTWQRTQAELAQAFGGFNPVNPIGPIPAPQQQILVNAARSLEQQSELLSQVAQTHLPNDRWGATLEQGIREFTRSVANLRERLERAQPIDAALVGVRARWDALVVSLSTIQVAQFPAVRGQSARVDQAYRMLTRLLGLGPVPSPVFPINNAKSTGIVVIGAGQGGAPVVRVFHDRQGGQFNDFMAYDPAFPGGVRVAVGDVNGDGIIDIVTAPGKGMAPLVRVFDGRDLSLMSQFFAYDERFQSGVFIAAADVSGNGRAEIITGAGDPGGPHVRAFDGMTGEVKAQFFAYDERLQCGVRVALGDVNGDGIPDFITAPGPGQPPLVRVFNGRGLRLVREFMAYEANFLGGVYLATADIARNGQADVITGAGLNGGPHVRVFDPLRGQLRSEFSAYDRNFLGGVRVAACDVVGDGKPDVITAPGPGMPPIVRVFRNRDGKLDREFAAFDPQFQGGAWVAGN